MKRTRIKRGRAYSLPVALRARVCANAYGRCQACMLPCDEGHVHHRKQRSLGGTDDEANLLWLDGPCHAAVHEQIARSLELGLLVASWDDPAVIAVRPWIAYLQGEAS